MLIPSTTINKVRLAAAIGATHFSIESSMGINEVPLAWSVNSSSVKRRSNKSRRERMRSRSWPKALARSCESSPSSNTVCAQSTQAISFRFPATCHFARVGTVSLVQPGVAVSMRNCLSVNAAKAFESNFLRPRSLRALVGALSRTESKRLRVSPIRRQSAMRAHVVKIEAQRISCMRPPCVRLKSAPWPALPH